MRIIGGEARGRRLFAPEGMDTRPTADRVKESLFGILRGEVIDARVLDLFAGSGALALEALSRGASTAALVDASRRAGEVISRNVRATGWEDRCTLVIADWRRALARLAGRQFTLVFLDPPYRLTEVYAQASQALLAGGLLEQGALLVMEHAAAQALTGISEELRLVDERKYRDTAIALYRYGGGSEP